MSKATGSRLPDDITGTGEIDLSLLVLVPGLEAVKIWVVQAVYHKNSTNWDIKDNYCTCPKNRTIWCDNAVMVQNDADGMANIVNPAQTAPRAV